MSRSDLERYLAISILITARCGPLEVSEQWQADTLRKINSQPRNRSNASKALTVLLKDGLLHLENGQLYVRWTRDVVALPGNRRTSAARRQLHGSSTAVPQQIVSSSTANSSQVPVITSGMEAALKISEEKKRSEESRSTDTSPPLPVPVLTKRDRVFKAFEQATNQICTARPATLPEATKLIDDQARAEKKPIEEVALRAFTLWAKDTWVRDRHYPFDNFLRDPTRWLAAPAPKPFRWKEYWECSVEEYAAQEERREALLRAQIAKMQEAAE